MSRQFRPDGWLDRWDHVGFVSISAGRVSLVLDIDGNATEQRHLLGQLDGKPGRRRQVRDAALARWQRG